jgi:uroporphyrin-III C-methyltransferase / precorrin-2 dehydrogenase / sirohydrochlorin ferrochelatase
MTIDPSLPAESPNLVKGHVCLVGAGPGDPELLTVKALKALENADAVLHDTLVPETVLALAHPNALKIAVGKRAGRSSAKQADINAELIRLARKGYFVVRLKSGDPAIFGRAGEELAACRDAGVAVSVIAGVTAATAAAASLGVSLTHRDHAQRLQFVTGHSRDGTLPLNLDWAGIADPHATTALYMGARTVEQFAREAIAAGLAPDTPAIAVENVSLKDEQIWQGTLATVGNLLKAASPEGPVIVLVGRAIKA